MEIKVVNRSILEVEADAIIVNLFEGVNAPGGATGAVDKALGGAIAAAIVDGEVKGKIGETAIFHTLGKLPARRVVVVGLGKQAEFNLDRVRAAAASAARAARKAGARRVATIAHGAGIGGLEPSRSARATVEGSLLGLYRYREFKSRDEDDREVDELVIAEVDEGRLEALLEGARKGRILSEATNYARDLVNRPSSYLTPEKLAEEARAIAGEFGLAVEILEREDMERLGMGALLGVSRGSDNPPKLIVLRYRHPAAREVVALVGKGLTFDSGGLSLKPAENMDEMKMDMAGAAAVLGALRAIAQLKPAIDIIGMVAATENMPSGHAMKPGDIVKSMSGKTIEVVNTDAEGRLTLADALTYARQLGANKLVDIATLTGAVIVALGNLVSGLLGNNRELLEAVKAAAEESGEKVWELPYLEEYKEQNKSEVADIKNVGGRGAGTITGALFVGEFAEGVPWAHLDIAGTAWTTKETSLFGKGATGVGVRTLVALVERLSAS